MFRLTKRLFARQEIEPSLVGIGNLVAGIIGGAFWLLLASIIPIQDYGQLNYYISLSTIMSLLSLFGLNLAVMTYLPKGNELLKHQANFVVFVSNAVMAVILLGLRQNYSIVLMLFGASFFAMTIAEALARKNYTKFPALVIGQRLAQLGLSIGLYFLLGLDGILIGYGLSLLLFSYSYIHGLRQRKYCRIMSSETPAVDGNTRLPILHALRSKSKFIVHAYITNMAQSLTSYVDKLMIGPLFGFYVLGLYQLGFQFLFLLTVIPVSLTQYLLPQESSGIRREKVQKIGLALATSIAIISFFVVGPVVNWLFPHYESAIPAARIMVLSVIPMTVNAIVNARLLASEKSKPVLIGSGIFLIALLLLMYVLGNALPLVGLAIALVVSLSIQTLVLTGMCRRQLFFKDVSENGR
jgi:O-antigen/teichoic acid export membrane protein